MRQTLLFSLRPRLRLGGALLGVWITACAHVDGRTGAPAGDNGGVPSSQTASGAKQPGPRLRPLVGPGAHPSLFGVAAKLQLGMPMNVARSTAPELFGPKPYRPDGFDDVQMSGEGDAYERLGSVVVLVGRKTALADLLGVWGEPVKGYEASTGSTLYWWFDAAARLRARLEDDPRAPDALRLVLEQYFPIQELVGSARDRLGFEREALLGMTEERAAQVYADYQPAGRGDSGPPRICRSEILVLPAVEYDSTFTRVHVGCNAAGVTSYEVLMNYGNYFALKDDIIRLLQQKYGDAVQKAGGLEYSAPGRRIRFRDDVRTKDASIQVSRASP